MHNRSWLRFSRRDSAEGNVLEAVCVEHGLRQLVTKPTRGPYLLDLVLTDLLAGVRCEVVKGISCNDHDGVMTLVNLEIAVSQPVERTVCDFRKADWSGFKPKLLAIEFSAFQERRIRSCLRAGAADSSCNNGNDTITADLK